MIAYYACPTCGSPDVQILNWTRPNENSIPCEEPYYMPDDDRITPRVDDHVWCSNCGHQNGLQYLGPDTVPFGNGYARAPERWALDLLQRADDPLVFGSELRGAELCVEEPREVNDLSILADRGFLERDYDEDGNETFTLTVLAINTVKHFRGRKRCVKCGDPMLDAQMPDEYPERCFEHRD